MSNADNERSAVDRMVENLARKDPEWCLGYLIGFVEDLARDIPEVERRVVERLGMLANDRANDAAHAARMERGA